MLTFIILHYYNIKDTLECIDSLKKFHSKVIVVSNSNDYDNLKIIKAKVDKLIVNKENLGFAKANNIGCKYAIDNYKPDFLCVLNNDIIIEQEDFIKKIKKLYKKYEFDALGPKILPEYTESNNPFPVYDSLDKVKERIKYTKKLIRIYKNPISRRILKLYLNRNKDIKTKKIPTTDCLGIALHGCGIVFSKKYYEKYNDVFYNDTFLFHEEEFLFYRCKHDNLTFLYSPEIEIIHKEGMSLDNTFSNNYKKMIFRNEEILKSLKKLEDIMINNEKI